MYRIALELLSDWNRCNVDRDYDFIALSSARYFICPVSNDRVAENVMEAIRTQLGIPAGHRQQE